MCLCVCVCDTSEAIFVGTFFTIIPVLVGVFCIRKYFANPH